MSYAPSVNAAREVLQGTPIEHHPHPSGSKGARKSLEEVAKKVREGRLDPLLRAWAGKILIEAGKPKSTHDQVQALLDAFRVQTMYVQDPVDAELVVAPKNTLCLDPKGICIPIRDCDDGVIALGLAVASCGIPIKVVAQAFDSVPIPTHVLFAAETENGWEMVEPSSDVLKVGEAHEATQTWEFNPFDMQTLALSGLASHAGGDFVGVGRVGLGDVGDTIKDAAARKLTDAYVGLQASVDKLGIWLRQLQKARQIFRPQQPFDPEPQGKPITGLIDFPSSGIWTQSMFEVAVKIWATGDWMLKVIRDAANGDRQIIVDPNTHEVAVGKTGTDLHAFAVIGESLGNSVVGVFNQARELVGGFTEDGRVLNANEVHTLRGALSDQRRGNVGAAPIVIGVIVGVVAIAVTVGAVLILKYQAEKAAEEAHAAVMHDIFVCAANPNCSGDKAKSLIESEAEARVAAAKAKEEADKQDPFSKTVDNITSLIKWLLVGGALGAALYIGAPLIKDGIEKLRK